MNSLPARILLALAVGASIAPVGAHGRLADSADDRTNSATMNSLWDALRRGGSSPRDTGKNA